MEKIILGLDPGLAIFGFGMIACDKNKNSQETRLVDFGIIETASNLAIGERLIIIYDDLQTLIKEIRPDLVAIEKFFFYRMANTILIAQAQGVLMLVLAQNNLSYVEYTPAQVKQALTGYGNADKYDVQCAVASELNLDTIPKPDDAADALAIALTAYFNGVD